MPIANFEELANGLSELAGFAPPQVLQADSVTAASFRFSGVVITTLEPARHRGELVSLIAELGPLPQEHALAGWLAMLDANYFLMDADAPRFCRNSRTGEAVLNWNCRLASISVVDVYRRVMQMVDVALSWRADHLLRPRQSAAQGTADASAVHDTAVPVSAAAAEADAAFCSLQAAVTKALGQLAQPFGGPPEDRKFLVRLGSLGVAARVGHSPAGRPGVAFIAIPFGTPSMEAVLGRACELMEANFTLLAQTHGATFCRDPWTGELSLFFAYPFGDGAADPFLIQLAHMTALAHVWHDAGSRSDETASSSPPAPGLPPPQRSDGAQTP